MPCADKISYNKSKVLKKNCINLSFKKCVIVLVQVLLRHDLRLYFGNFKNAIWYKFKSKNISNSKSSVLKKIFQGTDMRFEVLLAVKMSNVIRWM